MKEIRKHVTTFLKNYTGMKQELKVLEYEMKGLQQTLAPAVIEGKVFSRPGDDWVAGSKISDKTADIVVDHVDRQRNAKYHALKDLIYNMRLEVRRLEYYLSLLPEEEAEVIRRFYFDGLSWTDISEQTSLTTKTMQRRRRCGLDSLVNYYSVMENLPVNEGGARMNARFIGYLHEERYARCLDRLKGTTSSPGIAAMLYIISGCNELWNAGADAFINFETWEIIPQESMTEAFTAQGAKLLRLAYCYANGLDIRHLPHVIDSYFPGLEYVHLELAIEAMRLALDFSF